MSQIQTHYFIFFYILQPLSVFTFFKYLSADLILVYLFSVQHMAAQLGQYS